MKKILSAIVMMCPVAMWAQEIRPVDVKPGLWEDTVSSEITGMPATPQMPTISEEQLAKMPPAQRAQVESMMKARGGGSPRTTTVKVCLTKDSLRQALYNAEKSCTVKLVSSSSNSQQIHAECTRGNTTSVGEFTMERVDAEHMKGSGVMKTSGDSSTQGRSIEIKMSDAKKWLSADCGDVKPAGGN